MEENDKVRYMRRALELAEQGRGWTSPNPMVGCVVVKNGRILSEDYHHRCGEFHAERNALTYCAEDPAGADLFVTLEPCCHYGKTPPCTDIIIEKKIGHVYVGAMDSNPKVAGKGVQILRDHGIPVETGILEDECRKQNEVFFHYMETDRPFGVMKYAMTLDGKTACAGGDSKWVTGEEARRYVHRLRGYYRAIMAGIGTVLADDPMLNCRIPGGRNPVRVVCDSKLRLPADSRLVKTAGEIPVIAACAADGWDPEKKKILEDAGVTVIVTGGDGKTDLAELMRELHRREIDSVLMEGGGRMHAAALEAGIVDKVYAFIAPKLVGGAEARSPVEGSGIRKMADAAALSDTEIIRLGADCCISGYLS